MNIKKLVPLFLIVVIAMIIAFSVSYKITVSLRTSSEAVTEETSTSALPEETTTATQTPDVSGNSAAALTEIPTPKKVTMPADESWCLVLLNAFYKMDSSYEPQLTEVVDGTGIYLDSRVAEKFIQMYNAALSDSVTLTPASGYVSLDRQTRNYDKQVDSLIASGLSEDLSKIQAIFYVLPEGCSEHNYGLSIDIGWIADSFADSPAYSWLKKHAAEYGFVERYTADKEGITHYQASPWHWRYVGVDAAKAMKADNLCLEEYLGKLN